MTWGTVGRKAASAWLAVACLLCACASPGQDNGAVMRMANNELNAKGQSVRFSYLSEERSARTGGHLWREKVVEVDDGPMRRLSAWTASRGPRTRPGQKRFASTTWCSIRMSFGRRTLSTRMMSPMRRTCCSCYPKPSC